MTDKEKLSAIRAEIEKAMADEMESYKAACEHGWGEFSHAPSVYTRLQMLLLFIESLQKEDLEQEIIRYIGYPQEVDEDVSTTMIRKAARHFANWDKNHQ